ncbi:MULTISPECIES: type I-E CRISPR-associated protein Cas6/Cse3/CasE [Streptomyces]|uniref:Type I-E CRISPR-associated protein Cas6/Cse3/CasE n=1 Tax=Streptomyces albus TaxID=1888 RepID=A0A8H1QLU7_9ACTN|nr:MULTISPECIES: type I-E CRISPR-associated protein Cas6/Cse3/CasE [Streptomyces]TGG78471.1 type I-E CRISPR-associated protein Cas6/Cse3/CasE [Streptomyces albus]UVN59449.1 type I-E CRISPR-associated protein Cas6/Cse3/CasE [Streptomyces albus]
MSAYLTRIRLNPRSALVRRDLHDAAELHKTLMRLAPDNLSNARAQAGLLFRVDETDTGPFVLAQSRLAPHPDRLPPGYGHTQVRDLTPMLEALTPGMQVRYRIAANTCKQQRLTPEQAAQGRTRGKLKALTGEEALTWWHQRAEKAGLRLLTAQPTHLPTLRSRANPGMTHSINRFDGLATITDTQALTTALLTGIGKGRSYGAGLLSLAPAPRP